MEACYRRDLERGLLFRVYMEPYGTEGRIKCMHLQDSGIYKLYREKCEGVVWI